MRKTSRPPTANNIALYENAIDVPNDDHKSPTITLDAKSPKPFTVASVPKNLDDNKASDLQINFAITSQPAEDVSIP